MKNGTAAGSVELGDPDSRVHAAWITHVSEAADTSLREQVPERHGDVRSVGVATTSLSTPERLGAQDVSQPRHSLAGRGRGAVTMVSVALALAAVGIGSQHFGFLRSSQEPSDHTTEALSSPEGLSTGNAATGTELGSPKLIVQSSPAVSGEPARLGVTLWGAAANDAVVVLRGLPHGMELSTGHAVANGVWQLSAAELQYAWIAPPVGFVGSAHLVAELQLPNFQIVDRQSIHLEWTQGGHQIGTATDAPAALQHPNDPALLTERPDISAKPSGVDPSDRRQSSKRARERGNNDFRRSVNEGTRRVPSANRSVGDTSRPPQGFWDWSR
jgi:hypothetical protein